ncbi:MAG: hypothetical protein AB7O59_00640 [Pirellulales bacterium]
MDNLVTTWFGHPWGVVEFVGVICLIGTVGGLAIGAIAVVTDHYRNSRRDEMDATLKMEMIQRGMSAEEISTVLKATSVSFDPPPWADDCEDSCGEGRRAMREAKRTSWSGSHAS